ncbi:hypothetical protein ACDW_45350 (plasmid) [Acidovorax sp. DW039]|uniref:IS3 family transposase n=1 Tax=Acidovorax sp. DW039 TaxID=3095606 RepID=UPI00308F7BA4|nr:hypothetical protein ACDW_45350 [Acidovorax sp. DW039]
MPQKIGGLDSVEEISCADKARLISGLRNRHKLAYLLQVAGLPRSTFNYQCKASQRTDQQSALDVWCDEHEGRNGYRRITAALCNAVAELINPKCVQRLMRKRGLRAMIRANMRSRRALGVSDAHVPSVLQRDFCAIAPNQKWATDVTEFNVNGHKLYLSVCMDLYNREIEAALARTVCTGELSSIPTKVGTKGCSPIERCLCNGESSRA